MSYLTPDSGIINSSDSAKFQSITGSRWSRPHLKRQRPAGTNQANPVFYFHGLCTHAAWMLVGFTEPLVSSAVNWSCSNVWDRSSWDFKLLLQIHRELSWGWVPCINTGLLYALQTLSTQPGVIWCPILSVSVFWLWHVTWGQNWILHLWYHASTQSFRSQCV